MITVPKTPGAKASSPSSQPSEEMLLMALAHMKDIGRIPDVSQRTKPRLVSSQPSPSAQPSPLAKDPDNG